MWKHNVVLKRSDSKRNVQAIQFLDFYTPHTMSFLEGNLVALVHYTIL